LKRCLVKMLTNDHKISLNFHCLSSRKKTSYWSLKSIIQ